ncbi:hypothetical protein [Tabrizicola sp.]|uniref:hypothetical protein n=1 Tax=Tabrizicola sp. TaxID=2005166 RepID=UPI002FDEE8A4
MNRPATLDLTGKRAIVSAGASGIGHAIATAMQRAGARVQVCEMDRTALAELARSSSSSSARTSAGISRDRPSR